MALHCCSAWCAVAIFKISGYEIFQGEMRTEWGASEFIPGHQADLGTLGSLVVPALWTQKGSFNYALHPYYSENTAEDPVQRTPGAREELIWFSFCK